MLPTVLLGQRCLACCICITPQRSPSFLFWRSLPTFLCNLFPEHLTGTSSDVPRICSSQQRVHTLSAPMRMMTVRRPGVFSGFSAAISDTSCPGSILSDTCAATGEDTLRHSLLQTGRHVIFNAGPARWAKSPCCAPAASSQHRIHQEDTK